MAESNFDVVVIGGGPGGYVCAIRAAQLGFKVACVEKRAALGGTCLNVGCIPSKALLAASEKYEEARHGLSKFGIKVDGVSLDLPGMMGHKDKVVKENTAGIEFLFKKNKITWLKGAGRITAANTVEVEGVGSVTASKAIVIATGSEVTPLPGIEIDEKTFVSSTGALALADVPKRLTVIGGGVIGLELGSVWARLGSQVTVVEYLDRILPTMDVEVSKSMQKILAKQGLTFKLGAKVTGANTSDKGISLSVEPAAGGAAEALESDVVLVAIGRRPHTANLGLDAVGVEMDNRGRVKIGKHFETNVPGIYAIGDVVEGPMLAHKAEEEGVALAEQLAGQAGHVNHDLVPGVVYTWPEVAAVGKTEEELKAAGVAYKTGKFPFMANGRARASGTTDGFVKILADATTDKVLGVHMIGPNVSELIAEIGIAMEFSASSEDIARTCHAHPTLAEVTKEAALAVDGRALHI